MRVHPPVRAQLAMEAFGVDVIIMGGFSLEPSTPHTVRNWLGDE